MKLYIDTEFNGFGGQLISMALVSEQGHEFYEVVDYGDGPITYDAWVEKHVIHILGKDAIAHPVFQQRLEAFLRQFDSIEVIADWPDDLRYLCQEVITGPGYMIGIPKMLLVMDRSLTSGQSKIPHNALEDARAIRDSANAKAT